MSLLCALAVTAGSLVFAADTVGPVNVTTQVDRATVAALFPGLVVRETTDKVGDEDWDTLSVFRGKDELLRLWPCDAGPLAKLCIAYSRSRSVRTADGVRIGDAYGKVSSRLTDCGQGFERDAGKVLCRSVAANNVQVVLGKKGVTAEGMPDPKALRSWQVQELRWLPPYGH
jgi:hypothetical protein